jgi:hypothetical protein
LNQSSNESKIVSNEHRTRPRSNNAINTYIHHPPSAAPTVTNNTAEANDPTTPHGQHRPHRRPPDQPPSMRSTSKQSAGRPRRRSTLSRRESHVETMAAAQQFAHSTKLQPAVDAIAGCAERGRLKPVDPADVRDASAPNLRGEDTFTLPKPSPAPKPYPGEDDEGAYPGGEALESEQAWQVRLLHEAIGAEQAREYDRQIALLEEVTRKPPFGAGAAALLRGRTREARWGEMTDRRARLMAQDRAGLRGGAAGGGDWAAAAPLDEAAAAPFAFSAAELAAEDDSGDVDHAAAAAAANPRAAAYARQVALLDEAVREEADVRGVLRAHIERERRYCKSCKPLRTLQRDLAQHGEAAGGLHFLDEEEARSKVAKVVAGLVLMDAHGERRPQGAASQDDGAAAATDAADADAVAEAGAALPGSPEPQPSEAELAGTASKVHDILRRNMMAAALEADAAEEARATKPERRTVITSAADFFAVQARRGSTEAAILPWSRPMGAGARSPGSLAHCDIGIDTCDGADASSKEITSSGLPASQDDVMHHLGLAHKPAQLATMSKPKHKSTRAHKIAMMKRMGEKGARLSLVHSVFHTKCD